MNGDMKVHVWNNTKYDIGVKLMNGQEPNITAGNLITITADDVIYIDGNSRGKKPFSSGELIIQTIDGKQRLTLEDLGGYTDTRVAKHYTEAEIEANLKKSANQVKKWLDEIDDQVELDAIHEIAKTLDLPQSKMSIIEAKLPGREGAAQ